MTIKTIIFDLDNTLFDTEALTEIVLKQAVEEMVKAGLNCSVEEGHQKIKEFITDPNKFERLVKFFGPEKQEIIDIGKNKYYKDAEFDNLNLYPGAFEILQKLKGKFKLFLLTQGEIKQQQKKINALKINDFFEKIFFAPVEKKEDTFKKILELGTDPKEMLIIGDRIDKEIKLGNQTGMTTVRILKGKYKILEPKEPLEEPDYTINELLEILNLINQLNNQKNKKTKQPKIVTIGGGTGTSPILEGLKKYTDNLAVIVTVTDSGRSTGMLRKDLNIPAPGDTRNCLLALADSEQLLYDLFQYRFENGNLEGYSFGNLFIAALTKLTGSFEKAIEEASKILHLKGKVIPSTFDNINICAELEDGNILEEEDKIIDRHNQYVHLRPKIKKVFHNPKSKAHERAIKEIEQADLIVLSPGSLFTSVISNLVVKGIPEAINRSKAKKVYVCNIMTQVSQTYKFKASDHVKKILEYLKGSLDYIILNTARPEQRLIEAYEKENAFLVENDFEELNKLGIKIITKEVLDKTAEKKLLWEKKDLLRHDADKIAEVLMRTLEK